MVGAPSVRIRGLAALPPQVCALALGANGLAGLLGHWSKQHGGYLEPLPDYIALGAVFLAGTYIAKLALEPSAAWKDDLSVSPHLSVVSALPAALQGLAVRYSAAYPVEVTQGAIVFCWLTSLAIAVRFLYVNHKAGAWPDPSWFPATLLVGMTNVVANAKGPEFLRSIVAEHFAALMLVSLPLITVVAYRIFLSRTRDSVAPHAGMATMMAPCSFSSWCYFQLGMPFGAAFGWFWFTMSTTFFALTVHMLYRRRALWANSFQPGYVAFTFPLVSTAFTATLASERLDVFPRPLFRMWAMTLTVAAVCSVSLVFVRLFAAAAFRMSGRDSAVFGAPPAAQKATAKAKGKQAGKATAKASAGRSGTPKKNN